MYPDNQKVALYYSQALDKYVTIPFSDIQTSLNEEQIEEVAPLIALGATALRAAGPSIVRGVGAALRSSTAKRAIGGIVSGGRAALNKGKNLGKRIVDSWKKSKVDKSSQRRTSGPKNRRRNRDRNLDVDLGTGIGSGVGSGAGRSDSFQMPSYQFSGKIQGKSSWEGEQRGAASRSATQDVRMRRLNTQALQRESVVNTLKEMVNNDIKEKTISINEQEININNTVAKKILFVYESINTKNKKKMEKMLNESATSFNKVLTFALRQ